MTADTIDQPQNPVLESAVFIIKDNPNVRVSHEGVEVAAKQLLELMNAQQYSPSIWALQPLHPPPNLLKSQTKECLDWIFLVSALNFSFWSELEGLPTRYGVTWRKSWDDTSGETTKWEGYWSLLAALNKALAKGIPITDPAFYASETTCPDSTIREIFKGADGCTEGIALLEKRISIMREVGKTLLEVIPGQSYLGLLNEIMESEQNTGNKTLALLNAVVEHFPCFRDESVYDGRRVVFWKRAQILIAETWAAFYPTNPSDPHTILPDGVDVLTMFADYRVPQILHHLGCLEYSTELTQMLKAEKDLEYGSGLESSIRAGSIIAVEELKHSMIKLHSLAPHCIPGGAPNSPINCVMIDFFLWDLAKLVECGEITMEKEREILPCHRTRSIYY